MSDYPSKAQRQAWNNDGMDPDWRPSGDMRPEFPCSRADCNLNLKNLLRAEKEIVELKAALVALQTQQVTK